MFTVRISVSHIKAYPKMEEGSISANDNNWAGMLYDGDKAYVSRNYLIHIVDRVGGGDSFGAGLMYAISNGYSEQDSIEFAVAASCLKQTIEHDYNLVSVEEVLALKNGSGSGRGYSDKHRSVV